VEDIALLLNLVLDGGEWSALHYIGTKAALYVVTQRKILVPATN
jgi:hypothetical protein